MYYRVYFKETVPLFQEESLKEILFFNPFQKKYYDQIMNQVNTFGHVQIEKAESLRISLTAAKAENLFAFDGEGDDASILGGIVFAEDDDKIEIVHVFLDPLCAYGNQWGDQQILTRLLKQVMFFKKPSGRLVVLPYNGKILRPGLRLVNIHDY